MEDNGNGESGAPVTGVDRARQILADAQGKGMFAKLKAFMRLSGPGWLQSAITLGGGSLASSLYLGVLGGFALLWLQPLAMIIGIIMLSAIGYVTLSTGERPFKAIREHVNPVLGWGWILATLMANCVWALPQFNLAWASMSQNLMPGVFGEGAMDQIQAQWIVSGSIAVFCIIIVFCYDGGGRAVKFFDILLKTMVAVIVLSFFGVVTYMSVKGTLNWDSIGNGLIPDFRMLWTPASTFSGPLDAVGGVFRDFWSAKIVSEQQDVLVAAAATAVGINMTFLLPYSMLKRGWNKSFRGLAVFDLSTGLFIPFILATGCVVIASASQFHTRPSVAFADEAAAAAIMKAYGAEGFAAASKDEQAKKIEPLLTEAYGVYLGEKDKQDFAITYAAEITGKGKNDFAKAATEKVIATIGTPGFADKSDEDKLAALVDLLPGALKDKTTKTNEKLVNGYNGLAMGRLKEDLGEKELKAKIEARALAMAPADLGDDYAKITTTVDKNAFTAGLTKLVMDLGYGERAKAQLVAELPLGDRRIAAMLVRRDTGQLAMALSPLTGDVVANHVFGIGVVGMAVSSIIILMLINGFTVCEMFDRPSHGWLYRFGCMIPAVGIAGPFIWGTGAKAYLAIPTSVIGFIVIPIAYTTFALLLNQRKLLGDNMPKPFIRWFWNLLMFVGVIAVTIGSVYMAWKSTRGLPGVWGGGWVGLAGVGLFILLVIIAQIARRTPAGDEA